MMKRCVDDDYLGQLLITTAEYLAVKSFKNIHYNDTVP